MEGLGSSYVVLGIKQLSAVLKASALTLVPIHEHQHRGVAILRLMFKPAKAYLILRGICTPSEWSVGVGGEGQT